MKTINLEDLKKYLGQELTVHIDRPLGSKHPDYETIYTVNYGYIKEVIAGDNECLDVYVLGVHKPIKCFTGKCIAMIYRQNDCEDKLVVAPKDLTFTNQEIEKLVNFQEQYFKHCIITT